jgi:putative ribosome biogenesis GTPase RsgA
MAMQKNIAPLRHLTRDRGGGVREGDSRGRHTTTARSLHLCAGGACIIDMPGLRLLQPVIDEEALTAAFEDIDARPRSLAWVNTLPV